MFRNRRNSADTLSIEGRPPVSCLRFLTTVLRSLIFNFLFFTTLPLLLLINSPALFFKKPPFYLAKMATRYALWLLKVICGLEYKIEGLENIPPGKCIFASKHQSAWDTIIFQALFPDVVYVLKKELLYIPIYGNFIKKFGMIGIDRKDGRQALTALKVQGRVITDQGRKIVLFPEGSRTAPGEKSPYHKGIYLLYKELKTCPVVPVALNSGVYWRRKGLLKWPGVITLRFLKPLEFDLDSASFMEKLESRIEVASHELLRPCVNSGGPYEKN